MPDSLPGAFSLGMNSETIVKPPFRRPADPRPAMARETMNILEEVDKAQRREPSSKTRKNARYVH